MFGSTAISAGTVAVAAVGVSVAEKVAQGTSKLVLKGSYSPKYAARLQSTYQVFRNAGVEIVEHGLNRVLGRAAHGVTIENTIDAFKNGVKYYDPKYDTFIRFKDGIAVSIDKATGAIINVQEQAKVTARWILQ